MQDNNDTFLILLEIAQFCCSYQIFYRYFSDIYIYMYLYVSRNLTIFILYCKIIISFNLYRLQILQDKNWWSEYNYCYFIFHFAISGVDVNKNILKRHYKIKISVLYFNKWQRNYNILLFLHWTFSYYLGLFIYSKSAIIAFSSLLSQ